MYPYYKSLENKRTEEEEEEEEGTPPKDDIRCLAVPFCLARVVSFMYATEAGITCNSNRIRRFLFSMDSVAVGSNHIYTCICYIHENENIIFLFFEICIYIF